MPGQLGVNCGSGVFKHSCDTGPHAGSKTIADMKTSGAESVTECYLLIISEEAKGLSRCERRRKNFLMFISVILFNYLFCKGFFTT